MKVQVLRNSRTDVPPINKLRISMDEDDASRLANALAASSVPAIFFRNVDRSIRFNYLNLLWTTAACCLPFVEFEYCEAELWDDLDPGKGTPALPFELLWMRVFYRFGKPDYWIPYWIADDEMGVRRFLRCITDGRWKLRIGFEQSARDVVIGVEQQLVEQRLRERMQHILRSLPSAELSRIAESLPRLRTPGGIVQLSDDQVRHCLHAISRTIRLDRVMARLRMAAHDLDDPFQSDALWKQMACELNFAISTVNWFDRELHNPFIHISPQGATLFSDPHKLQKLDRFRRFEVFQYNPTYKIEAHVEPAQDRDDFLERSALERPEALRLIDMEATCGSERGVVHLVEYEDGMRFSAISHTYGMDVYEIFDCQCCTASWAAVERNGRPRIGPCPHHQRVSVELKRKRDRVVGDMVRMCGWLKDAGVRYAWHDGVCIAQHDEEEVKASIQRMGWVYAYAEETIVFLHYVGTPMAILKNVDLMVEWDLYGLTPRWQMRAWTFQESVLSAKRRYCIRVGSPLLGHCNNLEEFERMVDGWYDDDTSSIQVVEESTFLDMFWDTQQALEVCMERSWLDLAAEFERRLGMDDHPGLVLLYPKICTCLKTSYWRDGLQGLRSTFVATSGRSRFWSTAAALEAISKRESKHVGDRINCILALAGVKGFIVPKDFEEDFEDSSMKDWTLRFFSRQDQKRLEAAVYAINYRTPPSHKRSWAPSLMWRLRSPVEGCFQELHHPSKQYLEYKVFHNGKLQVVGDIVCVKAHFRFNNAAKVAVRTANAANFRGGDGSAFTTSSSDVSSALEIGRRGCADFSSSSSDVSAASAAAAAVFRDHIDHFSRWTSYLEIKTSGGQITDPPPPPFRLDSAVAAFRQYVLSLGPDSQQQLESPLSNSAAVDLWRTYVDLLCAEAGKRMILETIGMEEPVHDWSVLERIGHDQEAAAGISIELCPDLDEAFGARWGG